MKISREHNIPSDIDLADKTFLAGAVAEGKHIGIGLYMSTDASRGDIIAKYPCEPQWAELNEDGDLPFATKYVFELGKFLVKEGGVKGKCVRKALIWNPIGDFKSLFPHCKAYAINSSHPRSLDENYRTSNCCYGIKIENIPINCRKKPKAQLYIVALCEIPKTSQILLDYHWHLAWEGFWCLEKSCNLCIEGLKAFLGTLQF